MGIVLGGIVAVSFSYPFWLLLSNSSGSDSGRIDPTKGKLAGQAKIRGAFLNTGSKDRLWSHLPLLVDPDCRGWRYGSHRQLHPRALQAYRCSLCRGLLVDGEGTAPGGAGVPHIRRAPKALPAVRAWHLFRKRHADRCRQSPSEQAG
jgi:hypothetical protein